MGRFDPGLRSTNQYASVRVRLRLGKAPFLGWPDKDWSFIHQRVGRSSRGQLALTPCRWLLGSRKDFAVKIRIGGWFFLATCFVALYRVFPLGKSAALTILFVLSMLLHEVGHVLAARYYRTYVQEFGLCLWGGYIAYRKPQDSLQQVVILSCGVLTNLVLSIPFWFIPEIGPLVSVWNLVLFFMNILPVPAFDGGKILKLCARRAELVPATGQLAA
jgi:Zn-dependent protease